MHLCINHVDLCLSSNLDYVCTYLLCNKHEFRGTPGIVTDSPDAISSGSAIGRCDQPAVPQIDDGGGFATKLAAQLASCAGAHRSHSADSKPSHHTALARGPFPVVDDRSIPKDAPSCLCCRGFFATSHTKPTSPL